MTRILAILALVLTPTLALAAGSDTSADKAAKRIAAINADTARKPEKAAENAERINKVLEWQAKEAAKGK